MQPVSIEALHRREGVKLQRFLLRLLGNSADAADAHQETYLRMLAALSRTRIEQPSAFLFQVANNVALRMRNRQRLEDRLFQPVGGPELGGDRRRICLAGTAGDRASGTPAPGGSHRYPAGALPRGVPPRALREPLQR